MNPVLQNHLAALFDPESAPALAEELQRRLAPYLDLIPPALRQGRAGDLSANDVLLITYADQVQQPGHAPLATLAHFLESHATHLTSGVHVLPFYPWSSDDGFSVKDFRAVLPEYGTWDDLHRLGQSFDLMFDAVFNHISAGSAWFQAFLADDPRYRDFFVTIEGSPDLSAVVRPRALPLLTEFNTAAGPRRVWTTFSADQVDLNLREPKVVLELAETLVDYVVHGARFIRLDAIAYLAKEVGTTCIHLPATHRFIQFLRSLLDACAPRVALITETNVPHADNISYFGQGGDEAHLVYNFALPPLVVHAFRTADARPLRQWAVTLKTPSPEVTFFNFLASHDGIGLNPARGLLSPEAIDELVQGTLRRGGLISYKHNADGSRAPYEMNINFLDAIADPDRSESTEILARRLLTAHAIQAALPGVPAVYFHSLVGSRGDPSAAELSGMPRRINRARLDLSTLEAELADPSTLRAQVLAGFRSLLGVRRHHAAFDPRSPAHYPDTDPHLFVIQRETASGAAVLCLHNLSPEPLAVPCLGGNPTILLSLGGSVLPGSLHLEPFGTLWIE
jgi:sucrose phosphorylase